MTIYQITVRKNEECISKFEFNELPENVNIISFNIRDGLWAINFKSVLFPSAFNTIEGFRMHTQWFVDQVRQDLCANEEPSSDIEVNIYLFSSLNIIQMEPVIEDEEENPVANKRLRLENGDSESMPNDLEITTDTGDLEGEFNFTFPVVEKKRKRHQTFKEKLQQIGYVGDGLEVKESTIPNAGNGLFATKNYPKLSLITEYEGRTIFKKEADELRSKGKHRYIRVVVNLFQYIDGVKDPEEARTKRLGGGSFCNDGAQSKMHVNAKFVNIVDSKTTQVRCFIQALEDIKENDEVIVSYGNNYWKVMEKDIRPVQRKKRV
jgi:uncharacterized protein